MVISEDCLICEEYIRKMYYKDAYLASLHLSAVELRCKLQEKLHRVTWFKTRRVKLGRNCNKNIRQCWLWTMVCWAESL